MVESRWFRRAGPAVAAVGALVLIASTTLGAPGRAWTPAACAGAPRVGGLTPGTWYRIDPVLEEGGRVGQQLAMGRAGDRGDRRLRLDAESFAAGPFGGTILVGSDDGRRSRLSLVDVARACAWSLGGSADVVRSATVSADGAAVFEHRVDRRSRADLGLWQRPLDGLGPASRILGPIVPDARFGPTWLTELVWSDDGRSLVVESCGEVACRFRILDPASGRVQSVADPNLGDLVGLAASKLVVHGACFGLPCPLVAHDLAADSNVVLDHAAGQAVLSRDAAGRSVVVHEVGAAGGAWRIVGLDGDDAEVIELAPDGRRLVAGAGRSASGVEVPAGWVAFGPDGRPPLDGALPPILRHVPDGRAVPLDEVSR